MEQKLDNTTQPTCENCSKELFGRIDKRFCNDNCRNEFNRKKKQQEIQKANESMPEILKIIKKNYEILLSYGAMDEDTEFVVSKENLQQKGFNFNFFTSIDSKMEYCYCMERGWRQSDQTIFIKEDLGQARI